MRTNGVGLFVLGWFLFVKVIAGRWPSHLQSVSLSMRVCVSSRKG